MKRAAKKLGRFVHKYGFAVLVALAATGAARIALNVEVPEPVPSFALNAEVVYRAEVGAACFAAFYIGVISVVLALNGRGFVKLGSSGVEAQAVMADQFQQKTAREHAVALKALVRGMRAVQGGMSALELRILTLERGHDDDISKTSEPV